MKEEISYILVLAMCQVFYSKGVSNLANLCLFGFSPSHYLTDYEALKH